MENRDVSRLKRASVLCLLVLVAGILFACDLPTITWPGSEPEEPAPPEEPFEPPPPEPMPEQPPEPMPEQPPEPMPEPQQQLQQNPPAQQLQQNPPAQPQQPAQPPAPTQQPAAGSGAWTTDVAVTDIYPGKKPYGQFHVRITNNGPGTCTNVKVNVLCGYNTIDKKTTATGPSNMVNLTLTLNSKPGETQAFPTGLSLDTNTFTYYVSCDVYPGFTDPNKANNSYTEVIQ